MTYATLLVHLELGRANAGLLNIAADLAGRFDARVIGIAARKPIQMVYGDGYVAGDLYQEDQDETVRELQAAQAEFRASLAPRVAAIEWRAAQMYAYLPDFIANEARSADLILTAVASGDFLDASRKVDTGSLVMQAGKPVLIVPAAATALALDRVLVAWKDSRETRRAVSDAVPMLKQARSVHVIEIAADDDLDAAGARVRDVVAWLARHDVQAQGAARRAGGNDVADLRLAGEEMHADVVVAGAYAHSRLREWVLGGVTRDLLLGADRCSFVSH